MTSRSSLASLRPLPLFPHLDRDLPVAVDDGVVADDLELVRFVADSTEDVDKVRRNNEVLVDGLPVFRRDAAREVAVHTVLEDPAVLLRLLHRHVTARLDKKAGDRQ